MAVPILGVPLFGWVMAGVAFAYLKSMSGYSVTQTKMDQFSDPGIGIGPWTSQTNSQMCVPLVFGKSRYPLPILHYRLDGDQFRNMWLVLAVGEDWKTLSGGEYENIIHQIWVNDYKIEEMPEYTTNEEEKDANHSWYRLYPDGRGISFPWNVSGKHVFGLKADPVAESYSMICTHDATEGNGPVSITIRVMHEWPEGGAHQRWRVRVQYLDEVPGASDYDFGWQSQYFYATQTVEAGKDSHTQKIPGTKATTYTYELPYKGKFKVVLERGDYQVLRLKLSTVEILRLMREQGTDTETMASILGLSLFSFASFLRNKTDTITEEKAQQLADALGLTFDEVAEYVTLPMEGGLYLDSVSIDDPGGVIETCGFNGTSCLLVRIIDNTGELARPTVSALVEGGPHNPAEALKWLLTNEEIGRGVPEEHLDLGAFATAAEKADAYGYEYNRAICQQYSFEQIQDEMCACGRLLLTEWNGLYTPIFDEEVPVDDVTVIDFDTQIVAGSLSYTQRAIKEIPNSFTIKYVDSGIDYTVQDLVTDDAELQARTKAINKQTINLLGTTNQAHAWELGWYRLQFLKADMSLSFKPMPVLWGYLYPGLVFRASSTTDPYIDGTEWMVLGIEEDNPWDYTVKAVKYPRDAYRPPALQEWTPDVWIPGASLATASSGTSTPSLMTVTHSVLEYSDPKYVKVCFTFSNVPGEARHIRIYQSYTGYLVGSMDANTGYRAVMTVDAGVGSVTLIEPVRYAPTYYRFTTIDAEGKEASLEAAPGATVYQFVTLDNLPGYGRGEYGRSFYGG